MEPQVEKIRHVLLFEFNRGVKAVDAACSIRNVYSMDAISDRTAQKWFTWFKEGNFNLSDAETSGRRYDFDEERLNALIHENPRQSTRELSEVLECDYSTSVRHLKAMGKVQKWGDSVPH